MKTLKLILVVVVSLAWIFVTTFNLGPLGSLGELTTYKTGLLSVPLQENGITEVTSERDLNIYVDDVGIPHIYTNEKEDAAYGLGYMHAKDRYFQMEMISRIVQGRLSELLSAQTIESDVFWKPYEFEQKSIALLEEYKQTEPAFYAYLQSYSDGVNDYLENNEMTDPLYKALGEEPREWKAEYSLLFTWYMSWTLTYFDHHIEQQELLVELPENVREYFYPLQPDGMTPIISSEKAPSNVNVPDLGLDYATSDNVETSESKMPLFDIGTQLRNKHKFYQGIGSNNWVVNNSKTTNKGNILANDPHLYLTLPEAFYEAHLVTDNVKVYGFTIPGVPVIVSGHNDKISWGITNGEWDLVDRYKLQVKEDSLYLYEEKWVPFDTKEYTIKVKNRSDHTIEQRTTVHGKVLKEDNDQYYAQHWYAANSSNSVKAMYDVMQSQNWNNFTTALRDYSYPPQNFVYSDVNDNIGIVCAGELPDRNEDYVGQVLDGTVKYIPAKSLDSLWYDFNPEKKFLFSANQQPIQNSVYFGAHGLKDNYRAKRIHSLLEEKDNWQVNEIQKMQVDEVDISFNDFKELMRNYTVKEAYRNIAQTLTDWDGNMHNEANQALIFEVLRNVSIEEAKQFANTELQVNKGPSLQYFLKYLNDTEYTIPESKDKQEIVDAIFEKTNAALTEQFGDEWSNISYKKMSEFTISNIMFIPGLGEKIDDVGGNTNTININTDSFHPVFRAVYEINEGEIQAQTILAGGQSGMINSKHYKDQIRPWRNGEYKKVQFVGNPNQLENIENIIKFKR
ncbi:penicillin acylase family protein [uncultured Dokdonia sp.]|uniref:penicillin acylase family protein n=1 Tax=uncultured Dokdonia sp. TaxID=575653 RepID=UPI0026045CF0|nr:penicillin acylase family protein [uncultured Dokdonia sp.]